MRAPLTTWLLLLMAASALLAAPAGAQDTDEAETGAPPSIKIAVVSIGDPDPELREAAAAVERSLSAIDSLSLPADPGLRAALRGDPTADPDDGLGRARSARRELGMGETEDTPVLASLGRMSGALIVVTVRRRANEIEALVFDVERQAFYEGELRLADADAEAIAGFVQSRAAAAGRAARHRSGSTASDGDPQVDTGTSTHTSETAADEPQPLENDDESPPERTWLEDAWPFLVAGLLLAGALVYVLLPDEPAAPAQPVLRFIPGGD